MAEKRQDLQQSVNDFGLYAQLAPPLPVGDEQPGDPQTVLLNSNDTLGQIGFDQIVCLFCFCSFQMISKWCTCHFIHHWNGENPFIIIIRYLIFFDSFDHYSDY